MADKVIAVLSGKGGTGKTLVSVNLAAAAGSAVYADCDVEEPDGHLFFKPQIQERRAVSVKIPFINQDICDGCKKCVEFCAFNALAFGKKPIVFADVCHSCGGCRLVCDKKAITEIDKEIGVIELGLSEKVTTVTGTLNTGEASGVPIIKNILQTVKKIKGEVFIDCPPGSACVVMESIKHADYCVLVAEPTSFGRHNLETVYELVRLLEKPCGAVLNKCGDGFNPSEAFCLANGIEILAKLPFDKDLGKLNSDGKIAARENSFWREVFSALLCDIGRRLNETASYSQR